MQVTVTCPHCGASNTKQLDLDNKKLKELTVDDTLTLYGYCPSCCKRGAYVVRI